MCGPAKDTEGNIRTSQNPNSGTPNEIYRNGQWVPLTPGTQAANPGAPQAGAQGSAQSSAANAAAANTQANRPNSTTPAGTQAWTQDAQGNWTMDTRFSPYLQSLLNRQRQFDWGQFGAMQDGSQARQQTIDSAYRDAMGQLQPQFKDEQSRLASRMANQGLGADSAAGQAAQRTMLNAQNRATSGAMANAIAEGNRAGSQVFQNNLSARQQSIAEALKQKNMNFDDFAAAMGLLGGMPGFQRAGQADMLGALGMDRQMSLEDKAARDKATAEAIKALQQVYGQIDFSRFIPSGGGGGGVGAGGYWDWPGR